MRSDFAHGLMLLTVSTFLFTSPLFAQQEQKVSEKKLTAVETSQLEEAQKISDQAEELFDQAKYQDGLLLAKSTRTPRKRWLI